YNKVSKSKIAKQFKKVVKSAVLATKKAYKQTVSKTKEVYKQTAAKTKEVYQQTKQIVKEVKQTTKEIAIKTKSTAKTVGKEIKNPVVKSFNSFKEIGKDFKDGLDTRKDKALNSPYDFANYLTLGAVDGIWSGAKSRKDKMFNSPSDFLNYATSGLTDMVKGSVNPKDPLSKEHWLDSFGVATSVLGVKGVSSTKPTGVTSGKTNSSSSSSKGTVENSLPNRTIDSLYDKTQNVRSDINREIEKIRNSDDYKNLSKTQKNKLDRKLDKLTYGNVAVAEVTIPGVKKEFQAHSQIHSSDSMGSNLGDFTFSKETKSFKTYVEDRFPRLNDTEAKILEDISSQIKDPNVPGKIDLYTELDACQSCTNLIMEFRRKFPNIELNVYSENMR
ncbi:deaminase domain-containing protein, partial [Lysinibacillus sphaericus]|uniref:deaminase domain-containing protein n=1 Tax=Lysinibacillus sphaericus TaxID=1421 RepID=UPI0025A01ECD